MQERGYAVDHSTVQRWVVHYAPRIEKAFRKHKKRTGNRWRLDETYIKIKGEWKYLYRGVDKQGQTIDFLLTAKCNKQKSNLKYLESSYNFEKSLDYIIITNGWHSNACPE